MTRNEKQKGFMLYNSEEETFVTRLVTRFSSHIYNVTCTLRLASEATRKVTK
jgi:hypothetical protein